MKKYSTLSMVLMVVAALAALAVVGCGSTTTKPAPATTATTAAPATTATTTAAAGTIKIGALLDFTGPIADLGPMFEMGIKLALEEVNYTVAGKKIELIVEDSATSVDTAVLKAKKLVEQDGVKIIIGPLMGDAHLALGPYT